MKSFYCSHCYIKLTVTRKALQKFSLIIEVVEPHICLENAVSLDELFAPNPTPVYIDKKTIQNLDELRLPGISTEDLHDRRGVEHIKDSSAPSSVLDMIKEMQNSIPEHSTNEEPKDG